MPRRPPVPLSAEDQATVKHWNRIAAVLYGLLVVAAVAFVSLNPATRPTAALKSNPVCARWDDAASAVVTAMLPLSSDPDLHRLKNALSHLIEARSNCRAGWLYRACHEYQAIIETDPPHPAGSQRDSRPPMCLLAMRDERSD